jgi:UPF0716 protein FxsA
MTTVRRVPGWLVALLFFGVPLVEIIVLIQVGQAIGAWWTILLLIADSVFGAWLIKHEGRRAMAALSGSLAAGRMPARELADGALIVLGGALMLSPGFVTDLFGMLCILPMTRPLARRGLSHFFAAQLTTGTFGPDVQRPRPDPSGDVIQGEVVDD